MSYQMPALVIGQQVYHYNQSGRRDSPCLALVTEVGDRSVTLAVLPAHSRDFHVRAGVRHIDDPELIARKNEMGCWDYSPIGLVQQQLLAMGSTPGTPDASTPARKR